MAILVPIVALLGACVTAGKQATLETGSRAQFLQVGPHLSVSIAGGTWHPVQVDTGSIGLVVPRSIVGRDARDTGMPGTMEYSSSGRIFTGEYFTASAAMRGLAGPVVRTVPMRVLAVDRASCDPAYPHCSVSSSVRGVGMMGVGFARGGKSPADNPFLQLTGMHDRSMSPGYIITTTSITLGIASTSLQGFKTVQLQRGAARNDWQGLPACIAVNAASSCGSALVDTGISGMILRFPAGTRVPSLHGATVRIDIPATRNPIVSYAFAAEALNYGVAAAPASVRFAHASGSSAFVNTGRHLLAGYDYLYDAACGRVGFRPH